MTHGETRNVTAVEVVGESDKSWEAVTAEAIEDASEAIKGINDTEIVDRTAEELTDISEGVEPEFVDPLIGVTTPPCESIAELREQLTSTLTVLLDVASARNRPLVPTGSRSCRTRKFGIDTKDSTQIQRRLLGSRFQLRKGVRERISTSNKRLTTTGSPASSTF